MTINTDLLIMAPMLQDYLVDKDTGMPLANGLVSLYKDNARSFYKNWYYQTGAPGAYEWVALDNPLHLSSVGTIQDPNGNDVIPFYYPYEESDENTPEAYYITVYSVDENGDPATLQFTRENFPFVPSNISPTVSNPTWRNYILNNVYWRNIGSLDAMNVTDQVIAPSQHDGYTNGDIRFIKNVTGANDDLIFSQMTEVLDNDITPEFYINMQCSGVQLGETVKCIQYPISMHVKTLQNVPATLVFQGQNVAGNPNNYVDLYVYQFMGTGALVQPDPILIKRVTLNNDFQKFVLPFIFPDASNLTAGPGGDDALFLRVQFPLSATFNINHTKPQIYLSTDVPDNDFDTYDQIESIINSPRTGDLRITLNSFQPGWVIANDGVISNAGSFVLPTNVPSARANKDTWPLFNFLWSNTNAAITPIYTSAGVLSTRGATAIADWEANKQLQLTLALGRSFIGLPPAANITYDRATTPAWSSFAGVFSISAGTNALLYVGAPIYLTGTMPAGGNFVANTVYYAIPPIDGSSTTTFQLATTYANALAGTAIAAGAAANNGTNLVANWALGGTVGQARHTQLIGEIATHSHTGSFIRGGDGAGGTDEEIRTGVLPGTLDVHVTMTANGSSHPFNIIPPEVYGNFYFKL